MRAGQIRVMGGYASQEGYFADELIKMSQAHFQRQGARMVRVVKVAHAGRALARQSFEKDAGIGTAVRGFLGGAKTQATQLAGKIAPRIRQFGQQAGDVLQSLKYKVTKPSEGAAMLMNMPGSQWTRESAERVSRSVSQGRISPSGQINAALPKGSVTKARTPAPGAVSPGVGATQAAPAPQMTMGRAPTLAGPAPGAPPPTMVQAGRVSTTGHTLAAEAPRPVPKTMAVEPGAGAGRVSVNMEPPPLGQASVKPWAEMPPAGMRGLPEEQLDALARRPEFKAEPRKAMAPAEVERGTMALERPAGAAAPAGRPSAAQTPPPGPPMEMPTGRATAEAINPPAPTPGGGSQGMAGGLAEQPARVQPGQYRSVEEAAAAEAAAAPKGNIFQRGARKARGAFYDVLGGATGQSMPEAGGSRLLQQAGRFGAGAFGVGPDAVAQLGGGAAIGAGGLAVGLIRKALTNRTARKELLQSVSSLGTKAVGSADEVASLGLRSIGEAGHAAAAQAGMSPRQLMAMDALWMSQGQMPRSAVKQLERAAGMSVNDMRRHGGPVATIQNRARQAGNAPAATSGAGRVNTGELAQGAAEVGTEAGQNAGEQAGAATGQPGVAGQIGNFFTKQRMPILSTVAGVAAPVALGLGAYGAWTGMQGLAARNSNSQWQYGGYDNPLNYSPTANFPS